MHLKIFKIIFRNLKSDGINSFINIIGLTMSLVVTFLIAIYVRYEYSFDNHFEDADYIYRLVVKSNFENGESNESAGIIHNVASQIKQDISGIEACTRILPYWRTSIIEADNKKISESEIAFTDQAFFSVFNPDFIFGGNERFFAPGTVILTEKFGKKIFGTSSPLNKMIQINGKNYEVVGIIKDFPQNSHFSFNMFISLSTIDKNRALFYEGGSFFTYLKIDKRTDIRTIENNITDITSNLYKYYDQEKENNEREIIPYLQPLKDIHLHSKLSYELGINGDIMYVRLNILLAFFAILISTINFTNIYIATSEKRSKTIGVQKILGATRGQISKQVFLEVTVIIAISCILAITIISFIGKHFIVQLMGVEGQDILIINRQVILIFVAIFLAIAVVTSSYPSLYLSSLSPLVVFSGLLKYGKSRKSLLYKILTCFQFAIAIMLIISLLEIHSQISYLKHKDLGFDKKQVVVFTNIPFELQSKLEIVQEQLLKLPFVKDVTLSKQIPGNRMPVSEFKLKNSSENYYECNIIRADNHYINTLGLHLIKGRNFSDNNMNTQRQKYMIINERVLDKVGTKKILDQQIEFEEELYTIIGVVKDFHVKSLHHPLEPILIIQKRAGSRDLIVNIKTIVSEELINKITGVLYVNMPDYLPDYYILGDKFDNMYKSEERLMNILIGLTIIGLIISFMGVWAFTSLFIMNKMKEICIRKVHGASIYSILKFILNDFIPWIALALIITTPIAFYLLNKWVNNFSFMQGFSVSSIIYTIIIILGLVTLAVSYHLIKIVKTNPADVLRYE
ncbi:MAG: putative transport system permease protein [Bacteroidales bacterium]|nr:putative transport system permease protein [Bacteroidales bacterium]